MRDDNFFRQKLEHLTSDEFKSTFRTTRKGVSALVRLLEGHPVFQNQLTCRQLDPAWQIAVVLARFGSTLYSQLKNASLPPKECVGLRRRILFVFVDAFFLSVLYKCGRILFSLWLGLAPPNETTASVTLPETAGVWNIRMCRLTSEEHKRDRVFRSMGDSRNLLSLVPHECDSILAVNHMTPTTSPSNHLAPNHISLPI